MSKYNLAANKAEYLYCNLVEKMQIQWGVKWKAAKAPAVVKMRIGNMALIQPVGGSNPMVLTLRGLLTIQRGSTM